MVQSKVGFILGSSVFLFFLVQMGALIGTSILGGSLTGFTPPAPPTDPLTTIFYVISNIGIFFQLMGVSSEFFLVGTLIIVPITIGIFWAILELIRGV